MAIRLTSKSNIQTLGSLVIKDEPLEGCFCLHGVGGPLIACPPSFTASKPYDSSRTQQKKTKKNWVIMCCYVYNRGEGGIDSSRSDCSAPVPERLSYKPTISSEAVEVDKPRICTGSKPTLMAFGGRSITGP